MSKKKNKASVGKMLAVGAGVAALGAGAYYLMGPDGKKNQKKAKAWITKMKKEHGGDIKAISEQFKKNLDIAEKKAKPVLKQAKKSVKKTIHLVKKAAIKKRK